MTTAAFKRLRRAVFVRSRDACEHCRRGVIEESGFWNSAHLDHFWGRAKADETEETCWILCAKCDHEKTTNDPSNTAWLWRFKEHCLAHAFTSQLERIDARVQWNEAKGIA